MAVSAATAFVAAGAQARDRAEDLHLDPRVRLVPSPRQASLVLAAGRFPAALESALAVVHDQLAPPRGTVRWEPGARTTSAPLRDAAADDGGPVHALLREDSRLASGASAGEPPWLPPEPEHPWRGRGDHGQGGEGMMGGTPFGRPMAMTGPDRDGLSLDRLRFRAGPFLPELPPGLELDVVLQGDVVQEVRAGANPFDGLSTPADPAAALDERAVAPLETARAGMLLRSNARVLRLLGLDALARRLLALAREAVPERLPELRRLRRRLERPWTVRLALRGIGIVSGDFLRGVGGPVARAAGFAVDARAGDPTYRALGFEPVVDSGGDCWSRFRQRLREAEQSLDLAARADGRRTEAVTIEGPRGPRSATSAGHTTSLLVGLPEWIEGHAWAEAMSTLVSLDLDLEEAAAGAGGAA